MIPLSHARRTPAGESHPERAPTLACEAAAKALSERHRGEPWFHSVGMGVEDGWPIVEVLYLYRDKAVRVDVMRLPFLWQGFPVLVRAAAVAKGRKGEACRGRS